MTNRVRAFPAVCSGLFFATLGMGVPGLSTAATEGKIPASASVAAMASEVAPHIRDLSATTISAVGAAAAGRGIDAVVLGQEPIRSQDDVAVAVPVGTPAAQPLAKFSPLANAVPSKDQEVANRIQREEIRSEAASWAIAILIIGMAATGLLVMGYGIVEWTRLCEQALRDAAAGAPMNEVSEGWQGSIPTHLDEILPQ